MQLYDLLPNFIVDWVDSRGVVAWLGGLPFGHALQSAVTSPSARGAMVSQEWMINLDAGLIVLLVVWISSLAARMKRVQSIFVGILIASVGLLMAGYTMSGWMCLAGIGVFAVGEMLSSPKMNEYLGVIAPEGQKALYMGYANMPFAIGWVAASALGAYVYERMGEKAGLALRYLGAHGGVPAGVDRTNAVESMERVLNLDPNAATRLLWDTYHPYQVWYPFVALGLLSAVLIWFYSLWIKRYEHADV
jgi:proton-dependent oligopeptide transporter, POT family